MKLDFEEITITKLDAIIEQLETAIQLFFENKSPIAIHTLSANSLRLLKDLAEKRGGNYLFHMEDFIKEEYLKEYRKIVNQPANFFKHADNDPEGTLTFRPVINEHTLWQGCIGFNELGGTLTNIMQDYMTWMLIFYPQYYKETALPEIVQKSLSQGRVILGIETWNREQRQLFGQQISKIMNANRKVAT